MKNRQKRSIYSLIDDWSFIYDRSSIFFLTAIIDFLFHCNYRFFIKLRSSLSDRIYILTMKSIFFHHQKINKKIDHRKMKRSITYDRKFMIGSKNRFLKTDHSSRLKIDFWLESLVEKIMPTVLGGRAGILLIEYLPQHSTIMSALYFDILLHLQEAIKWNRLRKLSQKILLMYDNVQPHTVALTQPFLTNLKWEMFSHLPARLSSIKLSSVWRHEKVTSMKTFFNECWATSGIKILVYRYNKWSSA